MLGGDGSGAGLAHVAYDVEGVVAEEAGEALLIVLDLLVGVVDGGVFGDGAFQLHHHEGQSVDHHHHIAALALVLFHPPLVHHLEEVSVGVVVVDEPHQGCSFLAVLQEPNLQSVLHPEGKLLVVLFECADADVGDLPDSIIHRIGWQQGIEPMHRGDQIGTIERLLIVALQRLLVCVFGEFLVVCHNVNILYFLSRYFLS